MKRDGVPRPTDDRTSRKKYRDPPGLFKTVWKQWDDDGAWSVEVERGAWSVKLVYEVL
jgi:hypothetical protein